MSLSFRLACRRLSRSAVVSPVRTLPSPASPRRAPPSRLSRIGLASGAALTLSVLLGNAGSTIYTDAEHPDPEPHSPRPPTALSSLIRSYIVYSICSVPTLVDWSPSILSVLFSVPGLRQITQAVVRVTFFDQFVGGDTAEDVIPLLEQLRAENKGCLFAYSVEVDETEAAGVSPEASRPVQSPYKQMVDETIHCIDVAADFEDRYAPGSPGARKTWVAIKLTALLPRAESLISLSKHLVATRPAPPLPVAFPGIPHPTDLDVLSAHSAGPLTEADITALRELRANLGAICKRAQERGVRIIIDAEHSWYQPAIDAFGLSLMREFNALPSPSSSWFRAPTPAPASGVQPLVYATFQAYLRRTPAYLTQSLDAARAGGYALGVKLVRGAYHPHELAAHGAVPSLSRDAAPPVWLHKAETDACYDACAARLVAELARAPAGLGVLFGTHNWASAERVLGELARAGLAHAQGGVVAIPDAVAARVAIAQLYGMSDALTDHLVDRTRCAAPFVLKYIPYGNLAEVMPYLSRRAIENKSVLSNGAAADERRRAGAEIKRRLFG